MDGRPRSWRRPVKLRHARLALQARHDTGSLARSRTIAALVSFVSLVMLVGCTSSAGGARDAAVDITPPADARSDIALDAADADDGAVALRVLAINDLHGHLRPAATVTLADGGVTPSGGAPLLAAHVAALRAEARNTLFVSAGDLIGGSPLLSGLFHDEPTIEAMNAMGLDFNGVGNHEFDEGLAELRRMQSGGCHPVDGCRGGAPFTGARFQFLAANVTETATMSTIFPRYAIREVEGVRVAVVGMTLQGTPAVVPAAGVAGLAFASEVATVNALVPELRRAGAETIVVLVHQGGEVSATSSPFDGCDGLTGPIVDIAAMLDPAVDVIASAHTHQPYICRIAGRLVTSAGSYGRLITVIDLAIDRATGDVRSSRAVNRPVWNTVPPDPSLEALVARYEALAGPLENQVIGTITADLNRATSPGGQSTLGSVVADAQLEATRAAGAVVAFQHNGGLRADLRYARFGAESADGQVTYGEAYGVQPFGNLLLTATLTGAQLLSALERQFQPGRSVMQVSQGTSYAWSASRPVGSRVDPAGVMIDGRPLDLAASYRVTFNEALVPLVPEFAAGTDRVTGAMDLDALRAWFAAHSPTSPPALTRITQVP